MNSNPSLSYDFGKQLAHARSQRGLTVEEAARATRMRPAHIQALEDGNLSRFPNAAYAKSFLTMYARFLEVDVEEIAAGIDTTAHMRVADFQYLSNRASDEGKLKKAAKDSRYDFVVPQRGPGSWKPLIAAAVVVVVAVGIVVLISNLNRIGDAGQLATAPKPEDAAAAVRPLNSAEPESEPAPSSAPAAIAPQPARPVVVSMPPAAKEPEITRARPVSPAAALAPNDSSVLSDVVVVARPQTPPPPLVADPETIILEPKSKTWIVIRNGPGGEPIFEDYLYPSARPMRLPAGRYFIELKDPSAVTIMKNGQRVAYSSPGVIVQ